MQKRKGFTMIEVIVVVFILALLAAGIIPSMTGFIDRGKQTARDNNARTLFLAAQSALANELGRNQAVNISGAPQVSLTSIESYIAQKELADNDGNIYALRIDRGQSGYLKDILDPYVNDKALLQNTVLIECNIVTGNVLSCFYSEMQEAFSYGSGGYNVVNRSEGALRAGQVGYYGVEYTGKAPENSMPIGEIAVRLVDYVEPNGTPEGVNLGKNYGLLTLEFMLPENLRENIHYTITLQSSAGASELLKISGGQAETGGEYNFKLAQALGNGTLEMATQNPITFIDASGAERTVYAFGETLAAARKKLVLVLDAVDAELSISKNFPALGCGTLQATVEASDGTETVSANSAAAGDMVHTFFNGTGVGSEDSPYGVSSVRHLNNLRHNAAANYVLAGDVYVKNVAGSPANWRPLCSAEDGEGGFSGTLDGDTFSIVDVTAYGTARAGLFDTIGSTGTVKRLALSYDVVPVASSTMNGSSIAGGIAAENAGRIEACTVTGNILGEAMAGGVAGRNTGTICYCMVGAHVTAKTSAGGVAGESSGGVVFCEVGTASDTKNSEGPDRITGTPYFGAEYPNIGYAYRLTNNYDVENDAFTICANATTDNGASVGGVVGRVIGKDGRVTGCVNAALVHGYGGVAGGVIGNVDLPGGAVIAAEDVIATHCYNAGTVMGGENAGASGVAGGVIGKLSGRMEACYNTGNVNVYTTTMEIQSNTGTVDADGDPVWGSKSVGPVLDASRIRYNESGINYIGGLVGHGTDKASVLNCYNAAMAGDEFGGVFGLMECSTANIDNVRFLRNLHNTEGSYYFRTNQTNDEDNRRDDGIRRVSSRTLRSLNFDDSFSRGVINGVGPYDYTLPYYDANETSPYACTLGQDFHRTAYVKPLEALGDIEIENLSGGRIEVRFWTMPDSAEIKLVTNAGHDSQNTDTIPLTQKDLAALNVATEKKPASITAGGFKFEGYAVNADDARRYMGYQNEYRLFLRWDDDNDDTLADHLKFGTATLRAELWESDDGDVNADEIRYARSDTIGRGEGTNEVTMRHAGSSEELVPNAVGSIVSMDLEEIHGGGTLNKIESIEIVYPFEESGVKNSIIGSNAEYGNNLLSSYAGAVAAAALQPGNLMEITQGENAGEGQFALFRENSQSNLNLILIRQPGILQYTPPFHPDNGLLLDTEKGTIKPFYILVTMEQSGNKPQKVYTSMLYAGDDAWRYK